MTFLTTQFGKPFTAAGFGNRFRDQCNDAGRKFFQRALCRIGSAALDVATRQKIEAAFAELATCAPDDTVVTDRL